MSHASDEVDLVDDVVPVHRMKATSVSEAKQEIKTVLRAFQYRRTVVRVEVVIHHIRV